MSDASSDELDLGQTIRGFAPGQKLFRRYTLKAVLGRGGMGVVWRGFDEELERDVALKFLPELIVHDRGLLDDLKRETRRSLELTHHHIVRIYDFAQDGHSACIAMEYVDGSTLSGLRVDRANRVFEPEELLPILAQTCEALDYAHSRARVVHRDLKPANIMVNSHGEIKIADFGIARSLSDSVSMLTKVGGTSGTLVYMSPQQLNGERVSHLDDIYSLGATLYELITSRPPFYSGAIDRQIHERVPPTLAARREELGIEAAPIPAVWETVVASCLAKEPALRPQRAGEIVATLRDGQRRPVVAVSPPELPAAPTPPSAPRRPFVTLRHATVGALLLAPLMTGVLCFYLANWLYVSAQDSSPLPAYTQASTAVEWNGGSRPAEVPRVQVAQSESIGSEKPFRKT